MDLGEKMIDVTVKVPQERLAEFYGMFGAWLASESAPGAPATVLTVERWDAERDVELAREYWGKLSSPGRGLISLLVAEPDKPVSGEGIASALGLAKGKYGVAGVLAWPGRYAAAMGRQMPVTFEAGEVGKSANYWVTADVAALFAKVGA